MPSFVPPFDPEELMTSLEAAFGGTEPERRVVARQARDLADSGKPERDRGEALTVDDIVRQMRDAPDDSTVAERWNWWLGALEAAYGGYREFQVTRVPTKD
ncbi:hypothetical protein [Halogeometricum limi]|uniref:Uncharacterized protein n=1 Tax=Halogeometricum limi TaxID=555875 RepID=A0A1I6IT24_9EURY|nr:hypothetical protein [Halogeometricum limi]SFR69894.1 hypothetical protein SAMN04488124_3623 [Halogeometricum limi]